MGFFLVHHNGAGSSVNPDGDRSPARSSAPVRALILLAGAVRPGELGRAVGRSLLDLPVESGRTVLDLWRSHAEALASAAGLPSLHVRVAIDRTTPEPRVGASTARVPIQVERDPAELRGTGGILRDLTQPYAPDEMVLVANGAQILLEPLPALAADLLAIGAPVSLIGHRDGTPGGLFLVRCSVLRSAATVGFLDFKEQFLPRVAASGLDVRVMQRPAASGQPVRTLDGYIAGLRWYHRLATGEAPDPFAEDWTPTFAIREPGSTIDPSATIHDSVILAGARVERSAVVVRSVIGPGGVVRAGQTVADRVIGASRERAPGAAAT